MRFYPCLRLIFFVSWTSFLGRFLAVILGVICGGVAVGAESTVEPSNPLRFRHLTTEHGLAMNDVRAVVRDAQGFMWFGTTQAGLCRYDGYEMKVYQNDPRDVRTLSNNAIWYLLCDRSGVLWVATNAGLDRYHPESDSFEHFRHNPKDPGSLPHDTIISLFEDGAGVLWAGSRNGLSCYDKTSNSFVTYRHEGRPEFGANINTVRTISEDVRTGLLWVGTSDGVSAFDRKTGKFATYMRPQRGIDPINAVNGIVVYDRTLWLATEVGLLVFKPEITGVSESLPPKYPTYEEVSLGAEGGVETVSSYLRSMLLDKQGRLWVGSKSGVAVVDPQSKRVRQCVQTPAYYGAISDVFINRIYEDPEGTIWLGTKYGGVNRLRNDPFHTIRPPGGGSGAGGRNAVNAFVEARDGSLWLGSPGGLHRLQAGEWQTYRASRQADSLSDDYVTALAEDARGHLWVGTFNAGLCRFDGVRFERFFQQGRPGLAAGKSGLLPYSGVQISSLLPCADGSVWIGARAYGLDVTSAGGFMHVPSHKMDGTPLPTTYSVFGTNEDGALWYGTAEFGLVRMTSVAGEFQFQQYFPYPDDRTNQANRAINAVYPDGKGALWVGSPSGLFRFDLRTRNFTQHLTRREGLMSDVVVSVVADAKGRIWAGTQAGLSCYDPDGGLILNFGVEDGLPSSALSIDISARLRDGRLAFASMGGLTLFDPEKIVSNRRPPQVVLTDFSLNGQSVNPVDGAGHASTIQSATEIALNYDQRVFAFKFAALDFTAPGKNRYVYRMEGFDAEWREANFSTRTAAYTNLSPGRYVFRVRASNNDGVWNIEGARVTLIIAPPWWGTWWARVGGFLLVAGVIVAVHRARVRLIAERNEALTAKIVERERVELGLRASEERFRALYEDNPAMYFTVDTAGVILSVNRFGASLLGHTVEELLGQSVVALYFADDQRVAREVMAHCLAHPGELGRFEARKLRKDGRQLWVKQLVRAVRDVGGRTVLLIVCEDITARVEIEEQLRQSQKIDAFGQLAGGVAHDFNNILSVILMQAQLAQDAVASEIEKAQCLADIVEAAERAGSLTRQLLVFSRRQAMMPALLDLNQVIRNLARMLGRLLGEKVTLALELTAEPVPVHADEVMIEQVLVNLAVNARDAMPEGGMLKIKTWRDHQAAADVKSVCIEVSDTGGGIAEAVLPRIFEPFFTTKEVGKGTGLGLATSYGIIEQHRGKISVTSKLGEGTRFLITLPLYQGAMQEAEVRAPVAAPLVMAGTILLVEDAAALRESAAKILERAGYRVLVAATGDEGWNLWCSQRAAIDFVLTDMVMPGAISGRELIRRILEQAPTSRFGFMSGYAPEATGAGMMSKEEEYRALLPKPFTVEGLLDFVRERRS